jgi:hypothetical protein
MPSCSNSSNIRASFSTLSVTQGGSRLLVNIPFVSGLTTGQVIRYSLSSTGYTGYTAAKADTPPNSEVFGVIESYESTPPSFNVVIYGSINIDSSKLLDAGSAGASGGNDIYFLSGKTAGYLQNLAPTEISHIVKPVYQAAPHGSYTGVVVNYIGYRVGGDVQAIYDSGESVGDIQFILGNSSFESSYVDASIQHELPIVDYPEFYSSFSTRYGFIEKVTVSESVTSVVRSGSASQQTSSYAGTVTDIGTNTIYIKRNPTSTPSLASANKTLKITNNGSTYNFTINNSVPPTVYSVLTPIVTLPQPLVISPSTGSQNIKVGIKVKPLGVTVTIPSQINTERIVSDSIVVGSGTTYDVATKLSSYETRISSIESYFS